MSFVLTCKRMAVFVAAAMALGSPALAQEDHLNPEDSAYTGVMSFQPGYDRALFASFKDAFDDNVVVRAIVQPSFQTEFAVGVKRVGEQNLIFYQEVSQQLWQYALLDMMKRGELTSATGGKSTTADEIAKLEKALPANPADVKVNRCERIVDPALGTQIISVWREMLLESRYPADASPGLDGTTYHFSGVFGYQQMAAQTWSPPNDSKPGLLVNLAEAMKTFCINKAQPARLTELVNALSARLSKDHNK